MYKHGFKLEREEYIKELNSTARVWRHEKTKAHLVSILNQDENKCFGVNFRTPPHDSTGVAHILEHSVLCGSAKYPVKEPFVELLKSSLQTFLNAMTFPDKTCYPVASANLADFYNLVDVYLDAVFHPIINEEIFYQEGWHVEATEPDAPYSYKGVVFNEMKGVYSSPDSALAELSQQALFPDNTYSLDSGGNPEVIPQLTYAAFKDFHSAYYHPSNARFFFWGDDPEDARLELLEKVLADFEFRKVDSEIKLQGTFDVPRFIEASFGAAEDEERGHITLNWLLCEGQDMDQGLCLEILEHILLGLPGSPLRKALIDSGLGEDITGGGLETDLRQLTFSVGLRSIDPVKASEVEMLVMETLADLHEDGIDPKAVEAALNSLEFNLRENNSGRIPRGLTAMIRSLTTWLHDGDPLAPLAWEAPFYAIKARLANGEKIFEKAIKEWFLDNESRAVVLLVPDKNLLEQKQDIEQAKLDALQKKLNSSERCELVKANAKLLEIQQKPDSPEALASIPSLTLADLPLKNALLPEEEQSIMGVKTYTHALDTGGILYADVLFNLDMVPDSLLPLLPLFGRALTEIGTKKRDFVELGLDLAAHTGGLGADPFFGTVRTSGLPLAFLHVSGKATKDKIPALFRLMGEILQEPALDQATRFMQMVFEERARLEQSLIPAGHVFASSRLRARYSASGALSELTSGYSYLQYIRLLSERVQSDWLSVMGDLEMLHSLILRQEGLVFNLTGDSDVLELSLPQLGALAAALPKCECQEKCIRQALKLPKGEILAVPAQVNYVGKGADLYALGYKWHGSAHVVTRHLRMAWLWDQVRVQGGAYGVFCGLDRMSGVWTQVSYRDPQVVKTLAAYDNSAEWLKNLHINQRELTNAIVGAIGDLDVYLLPDAKGMTSLGRRLMEDDVQNRQQMRDEILGTSVADFKNFAEILSEIDKNSSISILGGSEAEKYGQAHDFKIEKVF